MMKAVRTEALLGFMMEELHVMVVKEMISTIVIPNHCNVVKGRQREQRWAKCQWYVECVWAMYLSIICMYTWAGAAFMRIWKHVVVMKKRGIFVKVLTGWQVSVDAQSSSTQKTQRCPRSRPKPVCVDGLWLYTLGWWEYIRQGRTTQSGNCILRTD